ncbi:hypothetical protein KQI08_09860 [Paraeggerthella hongkongensis]|uniref:lipopolysaccharide biosynthesis protein n=1 Tax=Paraeggerthella hominis TaxID=2897351 RepID=UPI001C0F9AA3|nr:MULTISPECIES: hypothetical protein [Paraeggerthella]MBU5406210.1 hypothetical protein [Paraeggerthella hongkongensis]MCD2434059.1 hypothetical protein [Paraeggerthella hominis]
MSRHPLSIKANVLWNSIGNIVYLFSQWLLTYFVVRVLGYEEAGVFSLAITVGGSLVSIALYSIRNYQVSDIEGRFSSGTYLVTRVLTSALALLVCAVFVLANGYEPMTALCVVTYMLFKISEAWSDVYQGMLQKNMRLDYVGRSFIVKGIVEPIVFFVLLVTTDTLLFAVLGLCVTSFLIVAFYDRRLASSVTLDASSWSSFACVKSLLKTCLPLAMFGLLFNTMGQAPRYFLEAQIGTTALGVYASVAMPVVIVQVSASFIFAPLTTPLAEHLQAGDIGRFHKLIGKVLLVLGSLSVVSIVGFMLWGDWLLALLFGDSIDGYQFLLMPLVVCSILVALAWFLSTVLVVVRKLGALLAVSVLSFAIVLTGSVPLIQLCGMNGASFVFIAALIFFIMGSAGILWRDYRGRVLSSAEPV